MPEAGAPSLVDLVIFDCDGVLVDSERLAVRVDSRCSPARAGRSPRPTRSWSASSGAADATSGRDRAAPRASVPEWTGRHQFTTLYAGLPYRELAAGRRRRRGPRRLTTPPTCVASSGTHDKMRCTLGLTGLLRPLRRAHLQRHPGRPRQARARPVPARRRQMGVEPGRCVVVEDSRSGVAGGPRRRDARRSASPAGSPPPPGSRARRHGVRRHARASGADRDDARLTRRGAQIRSRRRRRTVVGGGWGLNPRPKDYESLALTG